MALKPVNSMGREDGFCCKVPVKTITAERGKKDKPDKVQIRFLL